MSRIQEQPISEFLGFASRIPIKLGEEVKKTKGEIKVRFVLPNSGCLL